MLRMHKNTIYCVIAAALYYILPDRVEQWGYHRPLIKPYVRFSRIRLSDILLPSAFSIQPQILASPACTVNSLTFDAFPNL
jgi:hypothetical protein